jgi:hypothetical protein
LLYPHFVSNLLKQLDNPIVQLLGHSNRTTTVRFKSVFAQIGSHNL